MVLQAGYRELNARLILSRGSQTGHDPPCLESTRSPIPNVRIGSTATKEVL